MLASSGVKLKEAEAAVLEQLKKEMSGSESLKKSAMYLRKIWLQPESHIEEFTKRAIACYSKLQTPDAADTLSFFLWIANYPFAREVAETVGKFLRLQGTVKAEQIRRRMCEVRGERETVRRSSQYAVRLLLDFGYLEELSQHGTYKASPSITISSPEICSLGVEALFWSFPGKDHFRKRELETQPALFPFDSASIVEKAASTAIFRISRESYSEDVVSLKR